MSKILSIVVPTYNVEKYLDRCLISLLNDKSILNDIEIIVVNDGSKDNSLQIARKYEKEYPKTIVVVDKENGGHGSTINVGMEKATGKYFRVLDSDDWFNIDEFPKYINDLKKTDADLVLTNFRKEVVYDSSIDPFTYKGLLEPNKVYEFDKIDFDKFGEICFALATMSIKTEILRKANFKLDEKRFYVDMEYILFPIPYIDTVLYLDYDIYRYYIGRPDQSVSVPTMIKNREHHDFVARRLVKFYADTKTTDNKKKYIRKVLKVLLNTQYYIYCDNKVPEHAKKDIRSFDKYLKETSKELYEETNYGFIKANRKTNFTFAQMPKNAFSKIAVNLYKKRGGK